MYGPNIFTENVVDKNYCFHRALLQYKFLKGIISEGKYKQSKVTMRITLLGTSNKSLLQGERMLIPVTMIKFEA